MVYTRPYISQAVTVINRYMGNPIKMHWQAMKLILRYLRGTIGIGLVFHKNHITCSSIVGYVDSNYAGDLDRRKSQIVYVFMLSKNVLSWKATLQSTLALSTNEVEYMAAAEAVKEAIWLQSLVDKLGLKQDIIVVYCSN